MPKNNNSNKGWGGPFDFNRDGKTTWDETAFGLTLMEECRKNNSASSNASSRKIRESKLLPKTPVVPDVVDKSNYNALISHYRIECAAAIIAMIVFLFPAIIILWAVFSSYDPDNSASGVLIAIFSVAGLIYGGVILSATGKNVSTCLENIELVKKRYLDEKHQ